MSEERPCGEQMAVLVRDAHVKYGDLTVLKDLSMSVRKGTIYGLLGASGCGKTTLLGCVVGRRRLDSGHVFVLGVAPGSKNCGVPGRRVGYMPQEISLYTNFTVRENVSYFGRIFEMNNEELESRLTFLAQLLDLPNTYTKVDNLSGGQQRRVSLMVALLHDAELLVLDEPTVGMDSVLRQVIWQYLGELASSRDKTILITTHYIEEARMAHMIGLMRNGRLLEEESPLALLEKHSCESLEEVFLLLSRRQEEEPSSVLPIDVYEETSKLTSYELEDVNQKSSSYHYVGASNGSGKHHGAAIVSSAKMSALLYKNVLTIFRDAMLMCFFFGQCVVAVAALYFAYGGSPSDLPLAVVNQDATSPSSTCQGHQGLTGCNLTDLSCLYLDLISGSVLNKEFYESVEDAQRMVRLGKAWGALHFAENFSVSLGERMREGTGAKEDSFDQGSIHTWLDMSDHVVGWVVRDELYSKYREFTRLVLTACDINPSVGELPIRVFEPVYGTQKVDFLYTVSPGLLPFLTFLLGVSLSVWTIVHERVEGLLTRNIISGVTTFEIMLAYFACMFVMICAQACLIVLFAFVVFGYYNVGNLALVALFLVAQGTCGLFYGFTISAFFNSEGAALHVATGSLYPLLFLCGILWPVEGMNTYLYYLSKAMPLTLPVRAMRWIIVRGWTMRDTDVLVGFVTILLWMAVFLVSCTVILRIKKL